MIYKGLAYRAIHPKWAYAPLSGDGAAIRGGRFNPDKIPTLYLGTSVEVAILEASQGFAYKFSPLTMCCYEIDCSQIVDLCTEETRDAAGISLDDMAAPWAWALSQGKRPKSWTIYDALHKTAAGIRVPSFATGARRRMTNLVLWHWGDQPPHKVTVVDADNRLPANQASWKEPR